MVTNALVQLAATAQKNSGGAFVPGSNDGLRVSTIIRATKMTVQMPLGAT